MKYLANCSLLFTEYPLLERPAAAKEAGFDAVEFWWPWPDPVPSGTEASAFTQAICDAGVRLAGLNFFAGDLAGPDCGVLSLPKRSQEFRDSVAAAVAIGEELGVTGFNALYGNRVAGISPEDQDDLARENLGLAADAAARIGGCVLVEAVSGPKPYPLRTAGDSARVVEEVRSDGHPSIGVLLDLYHLAANGDDLDAAIEAYAPVTAHVQIADHPGRGEPGSGSLDLARHLAALEARGYPGWTALEYTPTAGTEASLAWMEDQR